jgi:hypothetical protein
MDLFNILLHPYYILQCVIIPIYLGRIKYIDKENIISTPLYIIISIISFYIFINLFLIMISYYKEYQISGEIFGVSILLSFIYFILLIIRLYENNFEFKNYSKNEKNITFLMIISNVLIVYFIWLCYIMAKAMRRF